MVELLLETDEPRELDRSFGVEIPELDAIDPMPFVEYTPIPAASTMTTAAFKICLIGYSFRLRSFLNPGLRCSIVMDPRDRKHHIRAPSVSADQ